MYGTVAVVSVEELRLYWINVSKKSNYTTDFVYNVTSTPAEMKKKTLALQR